MRRYVARGMKMARQTPSIMRRECRLLKKMKIRDSFSIRDVASLYRIRENLSSCFLCKEEKFCNKKKLNSRVNINPRFFSSLSFDFMRKIYTYFFFLQNFVRNAFFRKIFKGDTCIVLERCCATLACGNSLGVS